MTKLRGLVIYTHNLERLKDFYEVLGLELWEEKHARNLPTHYSCKLDDVLLELYPAESDDQIGKIRLEFSVEGLLEKMEDAVAKGGVIRRGPGMKDGTPNIYTVTIADPDGNIVHLTQGKTYQYKQA